LHPASKLGAEYTIDRLKRSINPPPTIKPAIAGLIVLTWYRGGDSNPYSLWPLPPQGSVSTNSTTSAKLLLLKLRHIICRRSRLTLLENRNIIIQDLLTLNFLHRRIRQTQ